MRNAVGFLFTVGLGLASAFCFVRYFASTPQQPAYIDRVFYTRFGGVYCGHMEYRSCGIRLWDCADERVYECLHEVAWKDVK